MATFTQLSDQGVAHLAASFGLGAVRGWRVIAAGTVNSNFALEAEAGRYFLRINEGKAEAEVRYEAALVAALAAGGVATPEPRRAADGRPFAHYGDKLVSLFPWIEGVHRCQAGVTPDDARAVGAALARLHEVGAPLAARFARDGIYSFAAIAARFDSVREVPDAAVQAVVPLLADEIARLRERMDDRAAAPRGVIHQDLFRDNVLLTADGAVAALIDFEQACTGTLVYDLAVSVNAWCFGDAFDSALVAALVAGYEQRRALEPRERALLPLECRAAAVRFAVTRITDVHLQATSSTKDFRRYVRRLEAWRALDDDGLRAWLWRA